MIFFSLNEMNESIEIKHLILNIEVIDCIDTGNHGPIGISRIALNNLKSHYKNETECTITASKHGFQHMHLTLQHLKFLYFTVILAKK